MSNSTHIVVHPKLYLAVGGKLVHVPAETELALTEIQAASLGEKVRPITTGKKVILSSTVESDDDKMKAEIEKASKLINAKQK